MIDLCVTLIYNFIKENGEFGKIEAICGPRMEMSIITEKLKDLQKEFKFSWRGVYYCNIGCAESR